MTRAVDFARARDARLLLLTVAEPPGNLEVLGWFLVTSDNALRRRLVEAASDQVDATRRVGFLPRLQRGAPRQIIPADVEALNVSVLVMGTLARLGVRGFLIGNTAEDVLNSVRCSVLTVKPPGYVTPLDLR